MNFRTILVVIFLFFFASNASAKPKILYESKNSFGSKYVYENYGEVCLSFLKPLPKINQSCFYPQRPNLLIFDYTKMVLAPLFINPNPQRILVIGLGGGSVPRALNKILPNAHIDAVEIDSEVALIAKKYFEFKESENVKLYIQDGYEFVSNAKSDTYDLIIIDAFTDDYVPRSFLTKEFVGNINKILSKDGIVAVNTFGIRNKNYKLESKLYNQAFGKFINLYSGSRVIIASKSELPVKSEISKNAKIWLNQFWQLGISTDWLVSKF